MSAFDLSNRSDHRRSAEESSAAGPHGLSPSNAIITSEIMSYFDETTDTAFLLDYGAEILFEAARFWLRHIQPSPNGTLIIEHTMGPEDTPSDVDEDIFTHTVVSWVLRRSAALYDDLAEGFPNEHALLAVRLKLAPGEPATWRSIAGRLEAPKAG